VAPYEADFQLVKLKTTGEIDFIISEDGDYIIHEVPTVYKLKPDGNC
jgi:5'-3' exonuclease